MNKFGLSLSELELLAKLVSKPPDSEGFYNLGAVRTEIVINGTKQYNNISVIASRLKKQKLLESNGSNYYRPTDKCLALLAYFYNQISLPLFKVVNSNEQLPDTF